MFTQSGTLGFAAPEVILQESYMKQVDMWSLGCLLFTMLCSNTPFTSKTEEETIRNIIQVNYEFSQPAWFEVSQSAKDLVIALLRVDPHERLSPRDVLSHAFVNEFSVVRSKTLSISRARWEIPECLKTPACYSSQRQGFFTTPESSLTRIDSVEETQVVQHWDRQLVESPYRDTPSTDIFALQDGILTPSALKKVQDEFMTSEDTRVNLETGREYIDTDEENDEYDRLRDRLRVNQLQRGEVDLNMKDSGLFKRRKSKLVCSL